MKICNILSQYAKITGRVLQNIVGILLEYDQNIVEISITYIVNIWQKYCKHIAQILLNWCMLRISIRAPRQLCDAMLHDAMLRMRCDATRCGST